MAIQNLITDHLDLWTAAVRPKSSAGRGSNSKLELTGIKKLRELILELAVRGKLVPQDPCDEPASVLLERIAAENARLVKEGKIKEPKSLPEIGEEERQFELPEGWEWKRLGDVVEILDSLRRPITKHARRNGTYPYYGASGIVDYIDDFIFDEPLILVGEDGAKWGKGEPTAFSIAGKSWVNNHAHVIRPERTVIVDAYLVYFLTASDLNDFITGITVPKLNQARLVSIPIAIPCIEEQHRIVAKVDEMMALCDQLEQQSEAQLAAHQTLVEALLATLTGSTDAEELAQNWARLAQHFDTLFTTEASIDAFKQTILQLAVMGKLVPQDPTDEPASALLERIATEKAQLVKEKKIKKEKLLPANSEDEKPFELPTGWEWCRVSDLGEIKLGRQRSPQNHTGEHMVPYLRVANVYEGFIDITDVKKMNFTPSEQETFKLQNGDILLNEGQSLELVGRASIYRDEVPGACFQNTLLRFRTYSALTNEYALLYFRFCLHSKRFQQASTQTTNIAHLSAYRLAPIEFPLAPKNEQHRIVAKTKELLDLSDRLKARLQTSQQTQLALAESLVEGALA